MKFFVCFIASLLLHTLSYNLNAQVSAVDSLKGILSNAKEDTNKIKSLTLLSKKLIQSAEFEQAKVYGLNAISLSRTLQFKDGEAEASNLLGYIYDTEGDYENAQQYYLLSLKLNLELKNNKSIAFSYLSLGALYKSHGFYVDAMRNYFSSLKIYELENNRRGLVQVHNRIGDVYGNLFDYKNAIEHYYISLEINKSVNDKYESSFSNTGLGIVYHSKGDLSNALKYQTTALKIRQELGDLLDIASSLNNVGVIYEAQKNYGLALENYLSALQTCTDAGDKDFMASSYINIASLKIKQKKYFEAKNILNKALQISTEIESNDAISDCYNNLSVADSFLGDWRNAYLNYKSYILYRDSLVNEENKSTIMQVKMEHELQKKEADIKAEVDKKNVLHEFQLKQKEDQMLYTSVIGLLILAFSFIIYQVNKSKALINQKSEMQTEFSKDLHDEIGYSSAAIEAKISLIDLNTITPEVTEKLNAIRKENNTLRSALKNLVWTTKPESQELSSYLNWLSNHIRKELKNESYELQINFPSIESKIQLKPGFNKELIQITKEALTNIRKYSKASEVVISFQLTTFNSYCYSIADNGTGFSIDKVSEDSNGLKNMQSRAKKINSEMAINTNKGGTILTFSGKLT